MMAADGIPDFSVLPHFSESPVHLSSHAIIVLVQKLEEAWIEDPRVFALASIPYFTSSCY
jgi:hypothetical protein